MCFLLGKQRTEHTSNLFLSGVLIERKKNVVLCDYEATGL